VTVGSAMGNMDFSRLEFDIQDWGLVPYQEALQRQIDQVELVRQELAREAIVFCTHPPVVTKGRATKPDDVFEFDGEIVDVNRGGRATYHGPNQVIVYPILDLNARGRDLHQYMRQLEEAVIRALLSFGVQASGRSLQTSTDGEVEATGVWVGSKKIASIGIGVRRWITMHGLALNVSRDEAAFQGLKPCGFSAETMTSIEEVLGYGVDRSLLKQELMVQLISGFAQPMNAREHAQHDELSI